MIRILIDSIRFDIAAFAGIFAAGGAWTANAGWDSISIGIIFFCSYIIACILVRATDLIRLKFKER